MPLHKAKSEIVHPKHVDPKKTHAEKLQESLGEKKLSEYEKIFGEVIESP